MKALALELKWTQPQREKAKAASVRRRDRLSNTVEAEGLAHHYTRKSPNAHEIDNRKHSHCPPVDV